METSIRKAVATPQTEVSSPARTRHWEIGRVAAAAGLCLAIGFLLTFRLDIWPSSWFDEGLNLATAGMIAEDGTYGLPDSVETRVMDPAIQTGPVVILPIALAFELAGVGLIQARIVMVLFAILALIAIVLLARRLTGTRGALIVIGLLMLGNGDLATSFLPLSRQVLGEVPVVGLFCLGSWLLARHIDRLEDSPLRAGALIGVIFGLAMITKSQIGLLLPVSLGLFWLANLIYYRIVKWWLPILIAAIACSMVLGWYAVQLMIAGFDGYQDNSAVLREGFSIHIARLSTTGPRTAAGVLWSTGFLVLGLPGLLYSLYRARFRSRESLAYLLPLLLTCAWLVWYTTLSIGWSRYAAIPLMLTPLFTARLIVDVIEGRAQVFPSIRNRVRAWGAGESMATVVIVGVLLVGFASGLRDVLRAEPYGHGAMVSYLQREVPHDSTIESWAWELDIFLPQEMHYPSTHVTNVYTLKVWDGRDVPEDTYDASIAGPDYVLADSFSTWTGIYDDFLRERGTLLAEYGEYRLYAVRPE